MKRRPDRSPKVLVVHYDSTLSCQSSHWKNEKETKGLYNNLAQAVNAPLFVQSCVEAVWIEDLLSKYVVELVLEYDSALISLTVKNLLTFSPPLNSGS